MTETNDGFSAEQIEALKTLVNRLSEPQEDEWKTNIKEVSRPIARAEAEAIKKELLAEFGQYIVPMAKDQGMAKFTQGLTESEAELVREMLKEKMEKAPDSVFMASNDPDTVGFVRDAAKFRAAQKTAGTTVTDPAQVVVVDPHGAQMDERAGVVKKMLEAAGIEKTDEQIVERLKSVEAKV